MIYQIQRDIQKAIKRTDIANIPASLLKDGAVISYNEQAALVTLHLQLINYGFDIEHNFIDKAQDVVDGVIYIKTMVITT